MRFYRRRHRVPELNTTSTADISFMLLVFFLVTTNMDVDKALLRRLPPVNQQEQRESLVTEGTVMTFRIDDKSRLFLNDRPADPATVQPQIEKFITSLGKQHLIVIEIAPQADYNTYFMLQNALSKSYHHIYDEMAQRQFHRYYNELDEAHRDTIKAQCPQHIAEQYATVSQPTDPTNEKGGDA